MELSFLFEANPNTVHSLSLPLTPFFSQSDQSEEQKNHIEEKERSTSAEMFKWTKGAGDSTRVELIDCYWQDIGLRQAAVLKKWRKARDQRLREVILILPSEAKEER